jgi:hypothetical protein
MWRREFLRAAGIGAIGALSQGLSLRAASTKAILIRGAYSSPQSFWDRGVRLDEYGINAVFVHEGSIQAELIRRVRAEGAKIFAEFPTFNGSYWLTRRENGRETVREENAAAWPINETGQRSPRQTWFLGICPTNQAFLDSRLQALEKFVTTHDLDGVFLDYLHWHAQFEDPNPRLPETCFNESCVRAFAKETGTEVRGDGPSAWAQDILVHHEALWRDWRCTVIVNFARSCRAVLERHAPRVLLGNYQCAWRDDEYGGARRGILGLDLTRMAQVFDVMSPMVYHGRSGHTVEWVEQNVRWLSEHLGVKGRADEPLKIWPIVQAWDDPEGAKVSPEEFERVLRAGLSGGSTGVQMFTFGAVAENARKMAALKRVYGELKRSQK